MNEKIRELAKRAGFAYEPTKDQLWVDGPTEIMISPGLEKFAELIVKECVSVLDPNGEYTEKYKNSHTPGPDGLRQVLSHEHFHEMMAANKLKKHFGVEE